MDRAVKLCVMLLLLLALMASPADGVNTQGLHWGLKSGDRVDYVYEMRASYPISNFSLNERIYIVVDALPVLPDVVTSFQQAICTSASVFWANGSVIAESGTMVTMPVQTMIAVGNWPLLTDLYSAIRIPSYEPWYKVVEDASVWGLTGGYDAGSTQFNTSLMISKSDGALVQYSESIRDLIADTELLYTQFDRLVEGVSTTVLVSAGIISVEVVVAVLMVRRYRH